LHDKKSLEIFLDKESLEVGDRWKVVIEEEIQKSQYFILLLSIPIKIIMLTLVS
jgi:hypothetical protein